MSNVNAKAKSKRPTKPARPAAKPAKNPRKPLQRKPAKPVVAERRTGPHRSAKPAAAKPVAKASNGTKSGSSKSSKAVAVKEPAIPADKDLSTKTAKGVVKDRIFLMVPDPHWLHTHWELTLQSVQRAEAALGQEWYGAKPVIRLFDVTSQDTTSTAETVIRDIVIHGGCNHWYIDIPQPPRTYRADIGYLTRRGHFHPLCRSNVVTPPKAGASEALEENWVADIDDKAAGRLLAMSTGFESSGNSQLRDLFDEQVKRNSKDSIVGSGAVPDKLKKFGFELNAELIVTGRTDPTARVTLGNEPQKIRADGTFVMRYSLTDGRQIIPAIATSADGMEERTIVLAVERNTKHLDPMVHDLFSND